MTFDWDAANVEHIARHERRRLCLGETRRGRLLTFVVIDRVDKVRFVTAYPMPAPQRRIYRGEDE